MSRRPLDLDLITPGCELYCSAEVRRDPDDYAPGGVVVEIVDRVEAETGEVARWFRCLDLTRPAQDQLALVTVKEADMDPDSLRAPGRALVSRCIRKLCDWTQYGRAAKQRKPRHGALSPEEVDYAHWIGALAHAIGQREVLP